MHARALTCCMAWREHLLHASESQALRGRAWSGDLDAEVSEDASADISVKESGESRFFLRLVTQRPILASLSKASIHILFNT